MTSSKQIKTFQQENIVIERFKDYFITKHDGAEQNCFYEKNEFVYDFYSKHGRTKSCPTRKDRFNVISKSQISKDIF